MGFDFKNLEDYQKSILNFASEFPELKRRTLKRMLLHLEARTIPFIPRDTGNLRASMSGELKDDDTGVFGTNVEYAAAVNDGHKQKKRFLPGKYLKGFEGKGVMLKEKFIPGAHFMEKGLQDAQSDFNKELESLLDQIEERLK